MTRTVGVLRFARLSCLAFILAGVALVAGCGKQGPPRFHLSGKVTYGGHPISAGSVTFVPDSAKGNTGPAASVAIQQGSYDTKVLGAGHVGGPHRVTIIGLDGKESPDFPKGVPIFPDYEIRLDLPKENGTKDLEVPSDWVPPKPSTGPAEPTA